MELHNSSSDKNLNDIIIVGAGLAGIGAAYWLQEKCPHKNYTILEARDGIGGTWDLFRYPGIRSDSDMFTFGYSFKPWRNPKSIADGASILEYIKETARENEIDQHIRFNHKVTNASWCTESAFWTVEVELTQTNEKKEFYTRFLYMCSGYYNYEQAHRPVFEGEENFKGEIVIPQFWPEELEYSGKSIIVVGSGATAVTLVPSLSKKAKHVTMLQRSPTYVMPLPNKAKFFKRLKNWLPERIAYMLTRWKNIFYSMTIYKIARSFPDFTKKMIMKLASKHLSPDFKVDKHFNPRYDPWDQRLCVVPDGDLFESIRAEQASVVTDEIKRFYGNGVLLKSGKKIKADIVVLATGLKIKILGGASLDVDGESIKTNEAMTYKGMMFSDVPNFAIAFGYTNNSWTLKTDLTANYVCRLLNYMDQHNYHSVIPKHEEEVEPEPFVNFDSGYINRAQHILPKQGKEKPWRVYQNYLQDMLTIRYGKINDSVLKFAS